MKRLLLTLMLGLFIICSCDDRYRDIRPYPGNYNHILETYDMYGYKLCYYFDTYYCPQVYLDEYGYYAKDGNIIILESPNYIYVGHYHY